MQLIAVFSLGDAIWSIVVFFLFVLWIMILFNVFGDLFRRQDLGGGAKALWVIFVVFMPYLGVFIYIIARGPRLHEEARRDVEQALAQQRAGLSPTEEIAGAERLLASGAITQQEFDQLKTKALA